MTPEQKTLIEAEAERLYAPKTEGKSQNELSHEDEMAGAEEIGFYAGAQFALSIANQWIKIEPGCKMPELFSKVLIQDAHNDVHVCKYCLFEGAEAFIRNIDGQVVPLGYILRWTYQPLPPTQ